MKKVIDRYLGASFIMPLFISTLFFVSFLLTFQLFRLTKLVINKGVPLQSIINLMGHISVSFLPMAIPLSVLFATIFTLNKLSADSEIIAMRSFGLSKVKLFKPFFILGILISIATYALNHSLIPYSKRQFQRGVTILTSKGVLADIRPGSFFTQIPGITIFSEKVTNKGKDLTDVFIHLSPKNSDEEKVIFAKRGEMIKSQNNEWGFGEMRMKLYRGNILKIFEENNDSEKIFFETYDFPLNQSSAEPGFVNKDSMRTSPELWKLIKKGPREEWVGRRDRNFDVTKRTIREYNKTKVEFWSRINTPLTCLLFILLGFSLGVQRTRGKKSGAAVPSLIILISYYSLYFLGVSMVKSGQIPAALAVFAPTGLGFLVAFRFYQKLEWVG